MKIFNRPPKFTTRKIALFWGLEKGEFANYLRAAICFIANLDFWPTATRGGSPQAPSSQGEALSLTSAAFALSVPRARQL